MGKDELTQLFQERFQGHEQPVDAGLWDAIQGQLAAPTPGEEALKDLFQDRFQGHEAPVDPGLWQQIGSQLGHEAVLGTAGTGGSMGIMGWAATGLATLVVAGGVYLAVNDGPATEVAVVPPTEAAAVQQETPAAEPAATPASLAEGVAPRAADAAPAATPEPMSTPEVRATPAVAAVQGTPAAEPNPVPPPMEVTGSQLPEPEDIPADTDPHVPDEVVTPPAAEIVETIIQEMTSQVEQEVIAESRKRRPVEEPLEEEQEPFPEEPVRSETPKLFMPNTFTPNGDGVNDSYAVGNPEDFAFMLIRVFDVKSNQMVFSTNTNEPWNGDNCADGYYLVAVEAQTHDGELVTQGKVVWLNRTLQH